MIDQEQARGGVRRRWGLPLGVAAVVSATGVVAVLALGGGTKPAGDSGVGPLAGGTTALKTAETATVTPDATGGAGTPSASGSGQVVVVQNGQTITLPYNSQDFVAACKVALDVRDGRVVVSASPSPKLIDPKLCTSVEPSSPAGPPVEPTSPVITPGQNEALPADRVQAILASCAPSGGPWQKVVAVKTAFATQHVDAMVIATNSKHEYVFCDAKGNTGFPSQTPTIVTLASLRVGNSHLKEYDGGTDYSDRQHYLMFNWGLIGPEVKKVTVSYGTEKQEYPALVDNGAFLSTASTPFNPDYTHPPIGYVHAYAADGTKLYDTPLS
ncbi:hypothetical protein GCM10009839_15030 [Catenulispora yoronensis]|uniref:Uncharacterized protein n=1 Tax=Catenulispora yoronensis TaxID=450799 RepID=A0ABN2TTY1_9ACTN